ncbi:hypothetical protein GCM10023221_16000 [Luteimicrobium xylanilyticum]
MLLFNTRLAWAPLTLSLAMSAVLAAISFVPRDIEVRGALWFLIAAVLLVGAFRAAYWRYVIGEVAVVVDPEGNSICITKRGRELARIDLDDLAKVETELGSDWPELSRWAVFPRIAFRTKGGPVLSQKVVMRDSQLLLSARDLATELNVPGPDD